MSKKIKYRTYRTSINIFAFSYYTHSKVYEIPEGKITILPGLKYSIATLFLGWWGFGLDWNVFQKIKNSIVALHINFEGGEDHTQVFSEMDYDEKSIWIYHNLNRALFKKTNLDTIDLIVDLQADFLKFETETTLEKNILFLNQNLKKLNIICLSNADFEEIVHKMKQFERRDV